MACATSADETFECHAFLLGKDQLTLCDEEKQRVTYIDVAGIWWVNEMCR